MLPKEEVKQQIKELIEKYNKIVSSEKIKLFNEPQTKTTFIQPFFKLLNWDVENPDEVSLEEKVSKKRVDYAFKINGITKFFVEAKSLKEDLNNPEFAKQAIEYSYNKGITWAVLTNFKEIKVFNAEWVPEGNIFNNQFISLNVEEFLEDDSLELLWLLSKESIILGELDKKAEKIGKKIKKQPIDKQLLSDFTKWRQMLSKNILTYNQDKKFTEEELDEVVQRILDRLIFIRKCEDNGLEDNIMKTKLREWEEKRSKGFYTYLQQIFRYFDEHYDSELFRKHSCDDVIITNDVLSEIVSGLYETKEKMISYDFSVIDADVLGSVYEQYLGHILKKGEKRTKLTENHVHRKEQGIYYTPTYIVNYIIRNTLGELIKYKKMNPEKISILDPACGSGSFLIKAFDVLNEYYSKKDKNYKQTQLDFKTGIPFTKKVSILQNNIFGVDLDKQAVEISQLNLLLKIAEKGHRLPLLKQNIKCGNSLIDDEKIAGDKAFKWEKEFEEIMDKGGFDIVVGNPPYGVAFLKEEKDFFYKTFKVSEYQLDSYILFLERAINLLSDGGLLGFIVPNPWLTNVRLNKLRNFILEKCAILNIVYISHKVFKEATVDTVIIIFKKEKSDKKRFDNKIKVNIANSPSFSGKEYYIEQSRWSQNNSQNFNIFVDDITLKISNKIKENCHLLREICNVRAGIEPYEVGKGYPKQTKEMVEKKVYNADYKKDKTYMPYLRGSDIERYRIKWNPTHWISYGKCLAAPRKSENFEKIKIVIRQTGDSLISVLDEEKFLTMKNTHLILLKHPDFDLKYCLGLINSKLMTYYFRTLNPEKGEALAEVKAEYVKLLPIKKLNLVDQQPVIRLVDKILSLNKRLNEIGDKKTDEKVKIEEGIKKTDKEIDELVYKIYGITENEKKIIEES